MTDAVATADAAAERGARRRARQRERDPEYARMYPTVVSVEALTPHLNRVTFADDGVAEFPFAAPDQWVKLFFPLSGQQLPEVPSGENWHRDYLDLPDDRRPPMRTYTVRSFDRERRTFVVDMILHGDTGPGSAWAGRAAPGDRIGLFGPGFAFDPDVEHEWILLIGDETAVPAIGAIVDSEPKLPVRALVEVDRPVDCVDLSTRRGECTWLFRHGVATSKSAALVDALRDHELPAGPGYIWIAGESSKVRSVRRHLLNERGVSRHDVSFIGYWRVGVSEDDHVGDDEEG